MSHWKIFHQIIPARLLPGLMFLIFSLLIINSCRSSIHDQISYQDCIPRIAPDYSGVTIPINIAPMNFKIDEEASAYIITVSSSNGEKLSMNSSDGMVRFPEKSWKKLLKGTQGGKIEIEVLSEDAERKLIRYNPFYMHIANEPMDPYVCYRLLFPGYEKWYEIMIKQRNIGNFRESSLVENQLLENNCVNCHSFNQNSPDRFLLHVRGSLGGTYIIKEDKIIKADLRTEEMTSGAVYPAWHPAGRYVAFSSNNVIQSFHAVPDKNIEVFDLNSSLILYDTEKNEIRPVIESDTGHYMETFPDWSPDGKYIYYCRANQFIEGSDFRKIRYNLVRKAFDPGSGTFGKTEIVYDARAIDKSVSFPRISPNGQYLVFTLHNYGTFSIWHKEADLYLLNLQKGEVEFMSLNSNETESYHSWSSNSKWLVFSSKRGDGLTARPYFAYIGSQGQTGKPFVLPQKDPTQYERMLKTFNKPEFVTNRINFGPRDFARASRREAIKAKWVGDTLER